MRPPILRPINCQDCGETVQPTAPNQKRCPPCGKEHKRKKDKGYQQSLRKAHPEVPCERCGKPMNARNPRHRFCSYACRVVKGEREICCKHCGLNFKVDGSYRVYCSPQCKQKYEYQAKVENRKKAAIVLASRNIEMVGGTMSKTALNEIYDGMICGRYGCHELADENGYCKGHAIDCQRVG